MTYLKSFPENEIVLKKIDSYIEDFKQSYVLVKGFEDDAQNKVAKLIENAVEVISILFLNLLL